MTPHIGCRAPEPLAEAISEAASEADTSDSEIIREMLTKSLIDGEAEIPEHLQRQLERERLKSRNRLEWQRIHFSSNVADKFRQAFEQGDLAGELGAAAVENLQEIYTQEAELLFDDDDLRDEAVSYVEAVAEHASEASDASEFDRLNPSEMFTQYDGVEAGNSRGMFPLLVSEATERILSTAATDDEALIDSLVRQYDCAPRVAREAVEEAHEEVENDGE